MPENSTSRTQNNKYSRASVERDELLDECHNLLAQVGRHRYALSLLSKAKGFLESCVGYKAGRDYRIG